MGAPCFKFWEFKMKSLGEIDSRSLLIGVLSTLAVAAALGAGGEGGSWDKKQMWQVAKKNVDNTNFAHNCDEGWEPFAVHPDGKNVWMRKPY